MGKPAYYRAFEDVTWPAPCEALGDLEWQLRYGKLTRDQELVTASVVAAYTYLISLPEKRRRVVIRELRQGPRTHAPGKYCSQTKEK